MTKWRASYLTPDEELLERLRKDRPQHATGPVCATSWRRQYHAFPADQKWEELSQNAFRRACFERSLATTGTAAEMVVLLSTPCQTSVDRGSAANDQSAMDESNAKRRRTGE